MKVLYKSNVKYSKSRGLVISPKRMSLTHESGMILKRLIVVSPSHLYVHDKQNYLSMH